MERIFFFLHEKKDTMDWALIQIEKPRFALVIYIITGHATSINVHFLLTRNRDSDIQTGSQNRLWEKCRLELF
ncbi:uncharacterized protein PHALS_06564 [Plasmopara halstedii]|uniref:Uncharacterized protein n=1 Tax=Plasmopara halstedii TaxID=4781 RepID=A0A0P1B3H6_PLAHL|nr:uncharacterized protein PHALS_06564 [Plasmopara halstedii]CEG48759.1 hypothetical protein PHALS_06564 [Plasmopara halstedii]|eukprot:XP_024585128.1 hypothetical protein PHALS_06564 [Plasmopara halstedii]